MPEFGYSLSSEEFGPNDLVRFARRAERAGFSFALISDHYHPWTRKQGQSPFVWSVIGGIAATTSTLRLGTGVSCPTIRIHPAVIAQAAATAAAMMLLSELPLPQYFEEAASSITEEQIAETIVCGPDAQKHLDKIS